MIKVFVSGSLMKKNRYHQYYLQGQTFLGSGVIDGYAKYILGGLDGIIPEEGKQVPGEVYEIDQAALGKLDFFYNGSDTFFTRQMVDVKLENGAALPAEVYIWNGTVAK